MNLGCAAFEWVEAKVPTEMRYQVTPDGRYFVVRGRLWRCANPGLAEAQRLLLVQELMAARSAKGHAMRKGDMASREAARNRVDAAKVELGERGPVWWDDGAPDQNRKLAKNSTYSFWWATVAKLDDRD